MRAHDATPGAAPLAQTLRRAARKRVKRARKRTRAILAGSGPEAVHDLRGDLRRLRTMLTLLREAPGSHLRRLARALAALRELAHRLGAVRDLDVLLAHVHEYVGAQPDAALGLRAFEADLERRHARAQRRLERDLRAARAAHVWRAVRRAAELRAPTTDNAAPLLVRHFAGSTIWRHYEALLRFDALMAHPNPAMLHRLRIACKQLNATLELFAEALAPEVQTSRDLLTEAQHHLGALHDDEVALERVDKVRCAQRAHAVQARDATSDVASDAKSDALAAYAAVRTADRDQLCATFQPLWARLSASAFREELARLIAAL